MSPPALDNGQRSPRKLRRAVITRLLQAEGLASAHKQNAAFALAVPDAVSRMCFGA
jgi:hypothetical protein